MKGKRISKTGYSPIIFILYIVTEIKLKIYTQIFWKNRLPVRLVEAPTTFKLPYVGNQNQKYFPLIEKIFVAHLRLKFLLTVIRILQCEFLLWFYQMIMIYIKRMKKLQNITLFNLTEELILFNQIWRGGHNKKWIQSCEKHAVPK